MMGIKIKEQTLPSPQNFPFLYLLPASKPFKKAITALTSIIFYKARIMQYIILFFVHNCFCLASLNIMFVTFIYISLFCFILLILIIILLMMTFDTVVIFFLNLTQSKIFGKFVYFP